MGELGMLKYGRIKLKFRAILQYGWGGEEKQEINDKFVICLNSPYSTQKTSISGGLYV